MKYKDNTTSVLNNTLLTTVSLLSGGFPSFNNICKYNPLLNFNNVK